MKNSNKKGFTIVELVIVIAVIAILAAVLIPTFSGLAKKANLSADEATVRNMNNAIAAAEAKGEKIQTVADAMRVLTEKGFNLTGATKSGYAYMWSPEAGKVLLVNTTEDGTQEITYPKEYKSASNIGLIAMTPSETVTIDGSLSSNGEKYANNTSLVFAQDVTLADNTTIKAEGQVNLALGGKTLDLGGKTLTIDTEGSTGTVIISDGVITNGTVVINAPAGNVYDSSTYGAEVEHVIQAVANESYHFYGKHEGNITVKEGHLVIEAGADVNTIIVDANANNTNLSITNKGSIGQVNIENNDNNNSQNTKITVDNKGKINLVINGITNDQTTSTVIGATNIKALAEGDNFLSGTGTKKDPYIINNAADFRKIGDLSNVMKDGYARYFKLNADIDLSKETFSEKTYVSYNFCGELDGQGHKLVTNDSLDLSQLSAIFGMARKNVTLKNIEYKLLTKAVYLCPFMENNSAITFDGVNISLNDPQSSITLGKNDGIYMVYVGVNDKWRFVNSASLTIKNSNCSVNVSNAKDYSAIYIGAWMCPNSKAIIDSCTYSGTYIGEMVSPIMGNCGNDTPNATLIVRNFKNTGTISGTKGLPTKAGAAKISGTTTTDSLYNNAKFEGCEWGTMTLLADNGLAVSIDNGNFVITKGDAVSGKTYELTIQGGKRKVYTKNSADEVITAAENSSYTFSFALTPTFTDDKYTTAFRSGLFVTKAQYDAIKGSDTDEEIASFTLTSENGKGTLRKLGDKYYYVFEFASRTTYVEDENGNSVECHVEYVFEVSNGVAGAVPAKNVTVSSYINGKLHGSASTKLN